MTAKEYILQNFDNTVRVLLQDEGIKLAVPYPFTVPCITGGFNVMYYWDTYFTNKGLILAGKVDIAKSNCDNVAYLIDRFGYMPNGTSLSLLGRSQPPFFALMVKDVFEVTGDKEWLKNMVDAIVKENEFWMEKRSTESGLNRYCGDYTDEQCVKFYNMVKNRIKSDEKRDEATAGLHYFAEAESGWDFTPRFNGCCTDFNPVDLNSLLYMQEEFLSEAFEILGDKNSSLRWKEKAENRKQLINGLTFDEKRGIYLDYNYKEKNHATVASVASFMPYFAKIVPSDRLIGAKKLLECVEEEFGLSATEKSDGNFQWGYKNAWAPLHLIAIVALDNYGYKEEATRIAKKYIDLVDRNFEKTGGLWEKYNAVTGGIDAVSEYGTPEMMGWTAGVYMFLKDYLEK
jgi:alpha,alpha-trehalase